MNCCETNTVCRCLWPCEKVVDELIEATLVDLVRRLVNDVTYVSKFVEKRALGILTRFLPRQERIGGDPLASAQSRYACLTALDLLLCVESKNARELSSTFVEALFAHMHL